MNIVEVAETAVDGEADVSPLVLADLDLEIIPEPVLEGD